MQQDKMGDSLRCNYLLLYAQRESKEIHLTIKSIIQLLQAAMIFHQMI